MSKSVQIIWNNFIHFEQTVIQDKREWVKQEIVFEIF